MTERFVPYEKLSKKEKRRIDRIKRRDWGGLDPVSRKTRNAKAYSRKQKHKDTPGDTY